MQKIDTCVRLEQIIYMFVFLLIILINVPEKSYARSVVLEPSNFSEACNANPIYVAAYNQNLICIHGDIDNEKANFFLQYKKHIALVFIDSFSGDAPSAIAIAKRIHQDGAILAISGGCVGVCASYLMPAARSVALGNEAVIAMNHQIDRSFSAFMQSTRGVRGDAENEARQRQLYERISNRRLEQDFFDSILISDNYVRTLESEIERITTAKGIKCDPRDGFIMIPTSAFLQAFGVKIQTHYETPNHQKIKRLEDRFPNSTIFHTFDDPEHVQVKATKCSNLDERADGGTAIF